MKQAFRTKSGLSLEQQRELVLLLEENLGIFENYDLFKMNFQNLIKEIELKEKFKLQNKSEIKSLKRRKI